MTSRVLILFAAAFGGAVVCNLPAAAGSDLKPAPSLKQQLLEDLSADPLDGQVQRELLTPDRKQPGRDASSDAAGETSGGAGNELNRQLLRELGAAAASEDDDPLLGIARQMRQVEGLIGRSQSGPQTQDLQNQIVAELEELLKQARSRCKQGASSAGTPQGVAARRRTDQPQQTKPGTGAPKANSKPVTNPNAAAGSSEMRRPDMKEMEDLVRSIWGELPPNEREQMLQLSIEEFLPKYELLIEAYFKRLAEEQGGIGRP